jgi:hypothetical protein
VLGQERDNAGDTRYTSQTSNHIRNVGVEFYPIAYNNFFTLLSRAFIYTDYCVSDLALNYSLGKQRVMMLVT